MEPCDFNSHSGGEGSHTGGKVQMDHNLKPSKTNKTRTQMDFHFNQQSSAISYLKNKPTQYVDICKKCHFLKSQLEINNYDDSPIAGSFPKPKMY